MQGSSLPSISFFSGISFTKYVSCCKSPIDQQWYYYENENVQIVNFNNMINNHNNNNFIPCLLVYNKSNKQC